MNAPDQKSEEQTFPLDRDDKGKMHSFFSALAASRLKRLLDQIDQGLVSGSVRGRLPGGSHRILGGRSAGPEAEMNIRQWRALARIAWSGSIGLYEGWAAGEWDSPDPVQIFALFMLNRTSLGNAARPSAFARYATRFLHWMRRNNRGGARRNIEFHYDLGNDFYTAWLDAGMTYSSAVFDQPVSPAEPLEQAQHRKNEKLLDRLDMACGKSLLEIGCGWGGLAEMALEKHKVNYHGITLSREQRDFANKRLARFGDYAAVTITDYRDVSGSYDAIASVEMVEAVGQEYWPDYLDAIARNLKSGGRAAIQYICIEDDIFEQYSRNVDFIQRYIFPGGMLISESRFRKLAQERGLSWCDQSDFGLHYAETLHRWRLNFDNAVNDGALPSDFDDKFIGLWRFYLMYCEGGFRGGGINVAQVTLIKQ